MTREDIMTPEVASSIVSSYSVFPENILDGYIVITNNKIWKSSNGVFLFNTESDANTAFYRDMRWRVSQRLYRDNPTDLVCMGASWRDTEFWRLFKSRINYTVKRINNGRQSEPS